MPIKNREDAVEVEERIKKVFNAEPDKRASELRALFVEVLDFEPAIGQVPLAESPRNVELPPAADRIAYLDSVHVLYVPLNPQDTERVRKSEAAAAARLIAEQLGDDLLLVFTNRSADQIHLILPSFEATRPTLRRMVIERDLPRRTAIQQVSNIYWNLKDSGRIREALEKTFDVEAVTRQFFKEYKQVFDRTLERVEGFGSSEEENESKKLFVQTLFNRLMFIYFLSRKGWLSFRADRDYLNALRSDYLSEEDDDKNFHRDRLRRLFFNGLNNPLSIDIRPASLTLLIGTVPFLNGGLFDKSASDERTSVVVPDECVFEIFDKLFDKFNFTVMESTPFDIEVAVDPEMLGKVFEELVTGRHDSGSYYTPRPVVSFMCREALKGFLQGRAPDLSHEAIAKFVDEHDASGIPIAAAPSVGEALDEITVVDPACGSGAYLLGMMQELVELQASLYKVRIDNRSLYDLKLHIIQRNLHGVDNDEFAVNIAMLRMWLSLSIEYEGPTPEPLPNLDFKVVLGDSLLGPDPSPENYGDLFRNHVHSIAGRLSALKKDHMSAQGQRKKDLKEEVEAVEWELREALADSTAKEGAVDWRVRFAEVFDRGGFDVALANPPYVQLQRNGGELSKLYEDRKFKSFVRTGDIYYLFYEQGINLLKTQTGLACFISSNQWMRINSGRLLRNLLEANNPIKIVNLGSGVFDSVTVNTCVMLVNRATTQSVVRAADVRRATQPFPPSQWTQLYPDDGKPWIILSLSDQNVINKLHSVGTPLREWEIKINRGIVTGYNNAFIIGEATRQALIEEDPKSADIIRPILRGSDIGRYRAELVDNWLVYIPWHFPLHLDSSIRGSSPKAEELFEQTYPAVYNHLLWHKKDLSARNKSETGVRYEWYSLQRWGANYYEEFSKEKIAWGNLNKQAKYSYVGEGVLISAPTTMLTPYNPYLLAMLNSRLLDWYLKQIGVERDASYYEYKPMFIERLPIPKISVAKQRPFERLVESILAAKESDPSADTVEMERRIDRLVYELYGLSEEEVGAVEGSLSRYRISDGG